MLQGPSPSTTNTGVIQHHPSPGKQQHSAACASVPARLLACCGCLATGRCAAQGSGCTHCELPLLSRSACPAEQRYLPAGSTCIAAAHALARVATPLLLPLLCTPPPPTQNTCHPPSWCIWPHGLAYCPSAPHRPSSGTQRHTAPLRVHKNRETSAYTVLTGGGGGGGGGGTGAGHEMGGQGERRAQGTRKGYESGKAAVCWQPCASRVLQARRMPAAPGGARQAGDRGQPPAPAVHPARRPVWREGLNVELVIRTSPSAPLRNVGLMRR